MALNSAGMRNSWVPVNMRGNGLMTVDVPGATVVAKGTAGTVSVLVVSNSGWANFRVARITSATGKLRRSTYIRATSRCTGFGRSPFLRSRPSILSGS